MVFMLLEALVALVTVFSLAVAVISAVSYRRSGSRKVLLVGEARAFYFRPEGEWEALLLASAIMDAATVALLFVALVLRRGRGPAKD